ncbi:multidrug MFS transporter [Paenibacillus etheri]|uniref:Multidrug MFS transporter n=2 Tax=Paenibacillus etheri TaxID=1306852 RepID=A0A0W1AWB1_9BACL|nr:multidrug MFS transporter [Paenibacillus etheri]
MYMTGQNASAMKSQEYSIKKAVPVLLLLFLLCLVIDGSFKIVSVDIAKDFNISATMVSWQATLAGLVFGIGAVVYAALSDTISIRRLISIGIVIICVGSVMGFVFQHSYTMVVISRVLQTMGLTSAETLYVIFVTKQLPLNEQKKFLGLSTSSFALSQVIGSLTGGFVSTYFHWTTLFLVSLVTLLILPFILKYLPKEEKRGLNVDVTGLFLVGTTAATLLFYITNFNTIYLIAFIVALVLFLTYISKSSKAFISLSFFKNKQFISLLSIVFVIYSVQLAYIFLFPFLLGNIFNMRLDKISLLLIPSFVLAATVGALSGKVAKMLGSKQCIMIAMTGITVSLLVGAFFIESSFMLIISMILFACSYAFMYAPLIDSYVGTVGKEKSGTAIGFYNLIMGVGASIGIAYTAVMMDKPSLQLLPNINNPVASVYSTILVVLSLVTLFSLFLYWVLVGRLIKK